MVDSAIAIYYTTKHSWRGKYKRLFAITPDGVATFNPQNPTDITNKVILSRSYTSLILEGSNNTIITI